MSILVDGNKRVLIQGITGREGLARVRLMLEYGTQVVAGVTPGKGGQVVEDIPVFDSVREAQRTVGEIDITVLFIPAPRVRNAALEAIEAGVRTLVIVPDRVPIYDVLEIAAAARRHSARFIGPNTLGVLSPEKAVLGMIGGRAASAKAWFYSGPVGVTSRSGGMTTSLAYYLAQAGIGTSTLVHVGGDQIIGLPHPDVLQLFEHDEQTKAVVMLGEIGTSQEEQVAEMIAQGQFSKPLIAYIGGKAAKRDMRFSHAGAIVESGRGTYEGKVTRLREAGAYVVDSFADLPRVVGEVLAKEPVTDVDKPEVAGDAPWQTAITLVKQNEIRLRGYRIDELMGRISFTQAIYLALMGELPSENVSTMMDAIFVSSIDHGVTPPSTLAARTVASTGAPLNAALASGILSINKHHGGAIEDCMIIIRYALTVAKTTGQSLELAAQQVIAEYRTSGERLAGFGHRIHKTDPRKAQLFELADKLNLAGQGVEMALALERQIAIVIQNKLPINVDGAIAALLVDLNLPTALANTLFIIARTPGLVAQIIEEMEHERPMRRIHPTNHEYRGVEPKSVEWG